MSLFTGQDEAQVHPLSQLVQIEEPPAPDAPSTTWQESELAEWVRRAEPRWARKHRSSEARSLPVEDLQRLAELRRMAIEILAAAADGTFVRSATLVRFLELRQSQIGTAVYFKNPHMPEIMQRFTPTLVSPEFQVPINGLKLVEGPQREGDELSAFLLWNLRHVLEGRLKVARCQECNAPFIIAPQKLKGGQKFCSRRHAAREGERRRRAERKGSIIALTAC